LTISPTDSDPVAGTLERDPEEDAANVVSLHAGRRYGGRTPSAPNDKLSAAQRAWLARGLDQPGGKLPLFDRDGKRVSDRTVKSCIRQGWARPWFDNPIKPDWLVCRLTDEGRRIFVAGD
jgi:hypothetical protein